MQVVVKTMEGCYIGETSYTYVSNLMTQFEHCVKALDDEDMDVSFSQTADEQVNLSFNNTCKCLISRIMYVGGESSCIVMWS